MDHAEDRFSAADGLSLFWQCWLPKQPQAAVVVVHGFVEHSGRYAELAEALVDRQWAVFAFDHRGHGRSAGEPVLVARFEQLTDDLDRFCRLVRRQCPVVPLFVFGHSMGGTVAGLYAAGGYGVSGVILSAAAAEVGGRVFPVLRRLAPLAARLFPRLRLVRLGDRMLSRDRQVVAQFRGDPHVFHGRFPICTGAQILRGASLLRRRVSTLTVPCLFLHGTGDVVTSWRGSQWLFDQAPSHDKTIRLFPGLYHDLLHEPEKQQILADIAHWLALRSAT